MKAILGRLPREALEKCSELQLKKKEQPGKCRTHTFRLNQCTKGPDLKPCPFPQYLVLQHPLGANHIFKYVFSHVGIHRRQGVIKEVDVRVAVHGPGQAHALLLAPRQVHTLGRHMAEGGFAGKPQDMQRGQPAWDAPDPGWRPCREAPSSSSYAAAKA